jgi:hypothetical protein
LLAVSIPVSQNWVFGAEACWSRAVTLLDGLDAGASAAMGHRGRATPSGPRGRAARQLKFGQIRVEACSMSSRQYDREAMAFQRRETS